MSSERFNEVARIFHEANRLPPDGRSEYLDHACRGDAALRQEVMELLVHDDAGAGDVLLGRLEGQMEVETAATVPPPRTSMPKQIGPYHIKSVIDTGGMATVYLGVQDQPRRHVAVKVMRRRIASSSNLRRFQYESQILARLRHPNIAKVYQAGVHTEDGEEVPYFAMEYVPNPKSITKYARSTKLGTRERLNLFAKVCDAVDHGHGKGIIHRDLKPGNILVDSNGDPKIIDFGVARATDSDMAVTTQQTDVGQLVGTLQYMSPEQCEADPDDLDIRSDVYALGVVLYELLTDQLPYDLTKAVIFEAMQVIRETPPVRPSSVDRTLRGDLETITLKALEKDRRHRYRSAADLGDDIAHYLNDEPIEARQQSMTYFVSKYMRRHKAGVVIVGLITLSAALGVAAIIGLLAANAAQARADATLAQAEIDLLEAANAARREEVLGNLRLFTRELDDILEESPGALLARVLIARRVLRDVDRVTNDGSVDPEVLLASARAHRDLSTVLGSRRNPSLGEHEEAIRHLDEAQADVDQILEGDPDSRPARLELAAIHLSIGDMLDVRREYEAAAEHVMEAETILRKLVDEQNDFEIRRLHAVALTAVGASQVRRNDFEASRETYTEALIAFERLAAEHPDDVRLKRDCSVVYIRLGARLGDLDQRRELYRKALDIREDLLAGGQLNNRERRDVAQNYLLLGNEFVRSDDLAEAIRYLDQYVDLTIELAWESPFDARAQNDLARAHEWIPDLFDETGATQQAILRLWLCRRPLRLLAERVPARRGLASTNLEQLGALLEEQGDADSARQMYTEAIDLVRALHAETRKREHRLQLARQLTRQGISLLELDGNAARAFLEEAIRLFGTEDEDSALDEEQLEWRRRAEDALGTTG